MSERINFIEYEKQLEKSLNVKQVSKVECTCKMFSATSAKNTDFTLNHEHFKQEGHQAINTMKEETP